MTNTEKEIVQEFFQKFKGLYNQQKISSDLIERILPHLPNGVITPAQRTKWEQSNTIMTEQELSDLANKISSL